MAKGVDIPVRVTGADQAKAEIKGVGAAASQAGAQTAQGQGEGAKATQAAANSFTEFNNKGERALKGVLRVISPELAAMADLTLDVAEGFGKMSTGMLAIGGAGAAIGAVVAIFGQLEKKAQDVQRQLLQLQELRNKQREDALTLEERVGERFEKAGVFTNNRAAAREVAQLGKAGINTDAATFGLIGQQIGGLSDAQREQLIAGFVAGGGRDAFEGNKADDARTLQRVLQRGGTASARTALESHRATFGERARREVAFSGDLFDEQAIETALKERAGDIGITPSEERAIREGAKEILRNIGTGVDDYGRPLSRIAGAAAVQRSRDNTVLGVDGARRSTGELLKIAEDVAQGAVREPSRNGSVIINVQQSGLTINGFQKFVPSPEVQDRGSSR